MGVVFQDTALLPHLTIRQNVAFGLRRLPRAPTKRAGATDPEAGCTSPTSGIATRTKSPGDRRSAPPSAGRSPPRPALLLLDEPFNNLDPVLKWELFRELRAVLQQTETTALFVTHDRDEAFTVADRLALLRRGHVEQVGDAETLYSAPANAFVARLSWAPSTCCRCSAATGSGLALWGRLPPQSRSRSLACRRSRSGHGSCASRPPISATAQGGIRGEICGQRFMGEYRELRVRVEATPGVSELTVHVPGGPRPYPLGQRVGVTLVGSGPLPGGPPPKTDG